MRTWIIARSGRYSLLKLSLILALLAGAAGGWFGLKGAEAESAPQAIQAKQADVLKTLGLFQGTDKGYELDQGFTRAQGAVMLLRLFGLEQKAVSLKHNKSPFADVPAEHWASKHVAYAKDAGLIRGISETEFGPDQPMTGAQYMTLVLRALGYTEAEPETAAGLAGKSGLMEEQEAKQLTAGSEVFYRGAMVEVSYRALGTKLKGSGKTMLAKLVEDDKAVSVDAAKQSGLYQGQGTAEPKDAMDRIEEAIKQKLKE